MKTILLSSVILTVAASLTADDHPTGTDKAAPPNFIVIFCDDLGYGDLGCYGSTKNRTPNVDQLAKDGMRFTHFYSSSPVCTPSRASLMTGCYPRRVGMHEDFTGHWVLIPRSRRGLHPDESTIAELLKAEGYSTACIGKWHLGDQPQHLPIRHGFDFYYGIPYSNDMQAKRRGDPPLPLVRQEEVIEAPADQATLTKRYTEQAIAFLEANRAKPFFLYLPHTFPHLPLFASEQFKGKSANGRYGDAVEEIDWSTGEILASLHRLKLADNTVVIFTSDNGSNGRNGGSNRPLSGHKGSTMEGGMRVPMIVRWPRKVPAGTTCAELATTMDVLPTFCAMAGARVSQREIDGHDIRSLMLGEDGARSPYEALLYYRRRQLQAVRCGYWKLHLALVKTHPNWANPETTKKGRPGKLVNLRTDPMERIDASKEYPEVRRRLEKIAADAMARLGDGATRGTAQRSARTLGESEALTRKQDKPAREQAQQKKQQKKKKQEKKTWTDPAVATAEDPGFSLQGEYASQTKGVQVIALGGSRFRFVTHEGGLPGLGWNREARSQREISAEEARQALADGFQKIHRESVTVGMRPPAGAVVLFDGTKASLANWKKGARMTDDGLLMEGATSLFTYQSARIHVEFRLPYKPHARGQGRGNSGLYVQGRYETQMLDSFGLEGKNNECGGIYSVRAPDLNMCLPPLTWQTYDIDFTPAAFAATGKKTKNARMTVKLNGVVIHRNVEVPKRTTASPQQEGTGPGPLFLQGHGNPVRFRNVWVLPR